MSIELQADGTDMGFLSLAAKFLRFHNKTTKLLSLLFLVSNHGWHSFLPECCVQGASEAAEIQLQGKVRDDLVTRLTR